jgi:hypothetical protein
MSRASLTIPNQCAVMIKSEFVIELNHAIPVKKPGHWL